MTVCIAAACDIQTDDPKIILCTDMLVSGALGSAETMLKTRVMGQSWSCLTAGDDTDILAFTKLLRSKLISAQVRNVTIDESNIGTFAREALAERKREKVDEIIRGQYAISYEDLLNIGKDKLPPEIFREAMLAVRDTSIHAECIVAGFGSGFPILMQTDRQGRVVIHEEFAVVGEGAYLAQTILLHRAHTDINEFAKALYTVYEAKKYAEGAPSVGKNTSIAIISKDGSRRVVTNVGYAALNVQYELYGPKPIPNSLKIADGMLEVLVDK